MAKRNKKTSAAKLRFTGGIPRLRPHVIISDAAIVDCKRDARIRKAAETAIEAVDELWACSLEKPWLRAMDALKAILREVKE